MNNEYEKKRNRYNKELIWAQIFSCITCSYYAKGTIFSNFVLLNSNQILIPNEKGYLLHTIISLPSLREWEKHVQFRSDRTDQFCFESFDSIWFATRALEVLANQNAKKFLSPGRGRWILKIEQKLKETLNVKQKQTMKQRETRRTHVGPCSKHTKTQRLIIQWLN